MKTFKEFSNDMGSVLTNLVAEAEGFRNQEKAEEEEKISVLLALRK